MKKNDLITIIVPVYKVEKFIRKCIDTLVNQTYKNLEILLVDDGSPDGSPQICDDLAKTDKRIKVIHKKNGGVSSARNEGLKMATGDWVVFVDSDDWIDLNMYESMLAVAKQENADIVFSRFKLVYDDGHVDKINEINLDKLKSKELKYFFSNAHKGNTYVNILGTPCRMLVKSDIAKNHQFKEHLKMGEDLFYVIDVVEESNKVAICDDWFYNYYQNSASVCNNINDNYFKNEKDFFDESVKFAKSRNLDYQFLINQTYLYRNAINRAKQPDFVKQMKQLEKDDERLKNCFNKANYKKAQNFEIGLKQKARNFLMYHKMWRLLKLLANKK